MPNKSCDCGIFVYNFTWNVVFNVSVSDQKCQREDRFLTKKNHFEYIQNINRKLSYKC